MGGWEPVALGDDLERTTDEQRYVGEGGHLAGGTTGYLTLDSHRIDLPDYARGNPDRPRDPPREWPEGWKRFWVDEATTREQRRALTRGLTYGEVVALIRNKDVTTAQLEAATAGRYLYLAKRNVSHFSNIPDRSDNPRNIVRWRREHLDAVKVAKGGDRNLAFAMNAAADHFLTDAFSGGHMRQEREKLIRSTTGQIEAKIQHDLDNEFGVEVESRSGERWLAYGDNFLDVEGNEPNRAVARRAV